MSNSKRPWSPPQLFWSAVFAIVVWTAIGFNWFGSGFNWTTRSDSRHETAEAVKEQQAAICVAQAAVSSDPTKSLQQFAEVDQWKQSSFVEEAQWAIMPGSDAAQSGVAALCAKKLREA